jgi:PAS domain S-box-containing protein
MSPLLAWCAHPVFSGSTVSEDSQRTRHLAELERAVDACGEVIFITNTHGQITFVNPQFTRVYGYAPAEVVGRVTPRILKSSIHSQQHYHQLWHDLSNGRSVSLQMVNRAKDGRLVEIEGSANPIVEDGRITGFVAVQRDVTMQNAQQHRARLAQFASDQAADGIFWVGQDGRIDYANGAAAHMLGYSSEELCTMTVPEIAPSFTPALFAEHFHDHYPSGKTSIEMALRRRDGTEFSAEIAISYRQIEGQRTSCAIVRDLTERKRLEAELQQAQKMEVIGRLTGGIAHDFNNLLTAILGYSELVVQRIQDNPGLAADVDEIKKAGERASRLTRQLLGFSRRQVFQPRVSDINQIVRGLRSMVTRVIGDDVQLEVVPGASLHPVKVDPSQVEQVLMNLLVNARDAMPKGGRATIATANVDVDVDFAGRNPGILPGPHVAVSVTDTGSGMPPEVLGRAFEPFFTTKPQGKGTGLGLATVLDIVKQSGGCVDIRSELGVGTTVTSYFPRVDEPLEPEASVLRPARSADGHETILLVEDDAAIRELAHRVLQGCGYRVVPGRNGSDALTVEANHIGDIHLLLTDVMMPELSGPDLAQRLVRRRPAMKVLYTSGFGHQVAVVSKLVGRQTAFLQKPFTPEMLTASVRELLDRQAEPSGPAPAVR